MQKRHSISKRLICTGMLTLVVGCSSTSVQVPVGHLPHNYSAADTLLPASLTEKVTLPPAQNPPAASKSFELPQGLPGSDLQGNLQPGDKASYPALPKIPAGEAVSGDALTLATLQQMAYSSNPTLRKVQADADAAYGAMIQAGLYPNPTTGYQADQMQPWANPSGNVGQQGAFVNQLIKTAGKLSLAQQVAGYDYLNALVAARRAQVDVITQIRSSYFSVLVAQQSVAINQALVTLADEVYELQRKQVRAGEAAAYEPLQLYAQSIQARNNLVQAEQSSRTAWRQLAASIGQPALARQPLNGRAETTPPSFDFTVLEQQLSDHTDLLSARNKQLQAEANLRLQQVIPYPDVSTNLILQYDNVVRTTQFGVQLGVALPLFDRNQGNIRQAQATIASTSDAVVATHNDLIGKLAEARGRYETNRVLANNYRELVLPNLSKAYRSMIRRYQVEPDKVQFNDIVVAQQNLSQSLQAYLNSLDAQWKAVVDIGNVVQLDDLFPAK